MLDPKPLTAFEWDDQKRLNNIEKHGIDFEDALLALQDPGSNFDPSEAEKSGRSRFAQIPIASSL